MGESTSGWTRREFVAASAAGVGALASGAAAWPRGAPAHAGGSDTLKVGLIGCGGRGTSAAVQAVRADSGATLHAMADAFAPRIESSLKSISGELGEAGAGRIDVPAERRHAGFEAYRRVIESCDVVILTTPPAFRPLHLRAAVEAGRHVFCEKPVAVDAPGCRSVLESASMARAKGLALVCGFCWRYSTRERETYERVLGGAIGDIRAMYTTYNTTGWGATHPRQPGWSDMEWMLRNWQYFTFLSGDHIVEQAVHSIDKIAWAMGGRLPRRCVAVGGRQARPDVPETGNVFDHFGVTYEYEGDVKAFHMCRHWPVRATDNSDYLMGELGACTVNGWTDTHVITGPNAWSCRSPRNDMYQQEHDELFASIRGGRPINDGEWMTHSTLMAIMGRMAAYTGEAVTWEQAMTSAEDLSPPAWSWDDVPMPEVARPGRTRLF